jgi:hypothetical protein
LFAAGLSLFGFVAVVFPIVTGLVPMTSLNTTPFVTLVPLILSSVQLTFSAVLFHASSKLLKLAKTNTTLAAQADASFLMPVATPTEHRTNSGHPNPGGGARITVRDFIPAALPMPPPGHGLPRNHEHFQPCSLF